MYRVDLAALAASAAHVTGLGEDVAAAHLASDNRIAGAESGWVGASAVALNTKTTDWLQASRRLLARLGDHAMDLANDGMCFAAAEHASAKTLRALGQV
jgi:WXG100 family type VII secretion target